MRKLALLFAIVTLSGCPHAPLSYQLARQGRTLLLIPPTQTVASASSDIAITINNARKTAASKSSCDINADVLSLQWRGKTAEVHLKSTSFYANADKQNPAQTAPGVYLDPLRSLESFRNDLRKLEWNGCLRPGESQRLLQTLTERLPFPPYVAFLFRFGSFDVTGILDFSPDTRLQIGSPLYTAGSTPTADHLIGHETAYYIFKPTHDTGRVQISLASATETLIRQSPVQKSTSQNGLSFPQSFGYFRLIFRTRTDAVSHASIATILFTEDASKLDEATAQRESGPADSCDSVTAPGVTCTIVPAGFGVSPEKRIHANGQDIYIFFDGGLSDALDALNEQNPPAANTSRERANVRTILKTLQIRRQYQGRLIPILFDPSTDDIVRLNLMPGDDLTWH